MNKKIDKKLAFFIILAVLLVSAGSFFLWKELKKEQSESSSEVGYEKEILKDYLIEDTSEGKIVKNKEEGFSAKVPDGWVVKDYIVEIALFSPEVEFNENGGFILESMKEKGACGISIQIMKTNTENLVQSIEENQKNSFEDEKKKYEVITVDDKIGLKKTYFEDGQEDYILVEIPVEQTVYSFSTGAIFAEKCVGEFDKFLSTVKIQ